MTTHQREGVDQEDGVHANKDFQSEEKFNSPSDTAYHLYVGNLHWDLLAFQTSKSLASHDDLAVSCPLLNHYA